MMANRSTDILFQLIRSLEKSEKRHFKLYIKRSSGNEDLKIVQLFDALDKMQDYDEKLLLKKLPFTKSQLVEFKNASLQAITGQSPVAENNRKHRSAAE